MLWVASVLKPATLFSLLAIAFLAINILRQHAKKLVML